MMTEHGHLESCPFCRGSDLSINVDQVDALTWGASVECNACDVELKTLYGEPSEDMAIKSIIKSWNTRPEPL